MKSNKPNYARYKLFNERPETPFSELVRAAMDRHQRFIDDLKSNPDKPSYLIERQVMPRKP